MEVNRLQYLLEKHMNDSASNEEKRELLNMLEQDAEQESIQSLLEKQIAKTTEPVWNEQRLDYLVTNVLDSDKTQATVPLKTVHRVHFLKTAWFRYAAAVLIIAGIGAYLWNVQQEKKNPETAQSNPVPVQNDVLPGGNKALLTLADGSVIDLDSAAKGRLAQQGSASIIKTEDGRITYEKAGARLGDLITHNTMSTPRGGQYMLTLSDGTTVWLNAESSITYPVTFNGKERKVKITGEVFFEVVRNRAKPFIVETRGETITVLGTQFNVNTYYEDGPVKTSLVEGSVKVSQSVLSPGQAYVNGKVITTNLDEDVAWKNGRFLFADSRIETIMNQVSRWYDVDIEYKGKVNAIFIVDISRDVPVSKLLKILELTGRVHFEVDGKKIVVSP